MIICNGCAVHVIKFTRWQILAIFLQQYIQSDVFYRIIKKNSGRTFDLMVLIRRADGGVYEERCIYNISSYHFSFIAKNNISME